MKKEYYTTSLQHILAELERIDLLIQIQNAYLQDDVTKKRLSVDLVLNLLCPTFEDKLAARDRFSSESPLLKYYLFHFFDAPSYQNPPLLSKYLKVDERVVNYLFGSDEIDTCLQTCVRLSVPQTCFSTSDITTLSLSCESCGCQKNTPFVIDGS